MIHKFYKLWFDDTNENPVVCDRVDLCGFNEYTLTDAIYIRNWPKEFTFYFDKGYPEDYLGNSMGCLLFSERVRKSLVDLGLMNIQFLPVNVINSITNERLHGYTVANVLTATTALDWTHATYVETEENPPARVIIKLALRSQSVEGQDIFLLKEQIVIVIVSQRIKQGLEDIEATGFKFIPVPVF
jgi:hypothetical protein